MRQLRVLSGMPPLELTERRKMRLMEILLGLLQLVVVIAVLYLVWPILTHLSSMFR